MDYQKITLQLTPDKQDFRDILSASLGEIGFESFVDNENTLEAYIPVSQFEPENIDELNFSGMFNFTYNSELIPDQNWNEVWEKNYFEPLLVSNKCLIRAPFHTEYPNAEYEIIIEPKMAFGTGNHETTHLMIEHILETELENKTILDMGCGTGILSMLASMRKAKSIVAIDIDSWAYESTIENCGLNNCNNVEAKHGDAALLDKQNFDIIFANIHKNILIEDMKKYASVLNKGGILIMSGFYEHDCEDIDSNAKQLHFKRLSQKIRNKWAAISYEKTE